MCKGKIHWETHCPNKEARVATRTEKWGTRARRQCSSMEIATTVESKGTLPENAAKRLASYQLAMKSQCQ